MCQIFQSTFSHFSRKARKGRERAFKAYYSNEIPHFLALVVFKNKLFIHVAN